MNNYSVIGRMGTNEVPYKLGFRQPYAAGDKQSEHPSPGLISLELLIRSVTDRM